MTEDSASPGRSTSAGPTLGRRGGAAIALEAVRKSFGSFVAVDGVDLTVQAGEFLTLLGPSGSGKTTILNMLAGFIHPDSGAIQFDGVTVGRTPPHRRDVGMVFQNYALFPHMSVAANVAFPLRMRGLSGDDVRDQVGKSLELVGMAEQAAKMPGQLSGGQQQRVALARALVYEPRIILMDEPLSALDRRLREHLQVELKELHRELGATVVYVTHDQGEALTMSDRVAVLDKGKLLAIATPRELYDRPPGRFVASFVGESNEIPGLITEASGEVGTATLVGFAYSLTIGDAAIDVGSHVLVTVRPERIRLEPRSDGLGLLASVTRVIFLGDMLRVDIAVIGTDVTIQVREPNNGRSRAWNEGDVVLATWDASAARVVGSGDAET